MVVQLLGGEAAYPLQPQALVGTGRLFCRHRKSGFVISKLGERGREVRCDHRIVGPYPVGNAQMLDTFGELSRTA